MLQYRRLSRAKVNLFLNIVGKDDHGYHLLESYFALLKFGDIVTLHPSDSLKCKTIGAVIEDENITLRAAKALQEYTGKTKCVDIEIEKNIPIAAGLGGGSSNAASTFKLINEAWNLNLSREELANIALKIGSDIPFFIYEHNSFVSGIGEKVLPITLDISLPIILVNPNIKLTAKEVYKLSVSSFTKPLTEIDSKTIINQIYHGKNDLEEPAFKLAIEIKEVINMIRKQKGCVVSRMSGSGSTCFGIFENEELAFAALHTLQKLHPGFWYYYEFLGL
jgi:4-diphosphocytidyl-2-C-methyl-D-erythritol kinase